MSTINTNPINVNYPVPGVNNNSQGFRDNFASIKNNLDIAGTELTDLQNKVVVKQALTGTTINNDMANTLISNALTRGFRASTYNLGGALAGNVLVDTSLADVHYGTVAANTTINFGSWPPALTQGAVQLRLGVSNPNAIITFSGNISVSNNTGATTLENFVANGSSLTVTAPYGVTEMDYLITTTDCGTNLYIEPLNRPRISTQIQQRTPSPTGFQGDVAGTVCTSPETVQLTVTNTYANDEILTSSTTSLYVDMPVVFTGSTFGGVTSGTTYYVSAIPSGTNFAISTNAGGANVDLSAASGNMYLNPVQYMYVAVQDYNATPTTRTVTATASSTNRITVSTTNLRLNDPIIFSGTTFGGITAGLTYYVKSIPTSGEITISRSRTNGVADSVVVLTTGSGTCTATSYNGSDIWKRIALTAW